MKMRTHPQQTRLRQMLPMASIHSVAPNVLTLLALCAGMTAIRLAMNGSFEAAVSAIIVAGVLDALDGRIARLLNSTSRFGAELDSLSDLISFGVAPAVVLHLWTMSELPGAGWVIVVLFTTCCALRLARFNVQQPHEPPAHVTNFFTGVPAPAGAGLVLLPMFASFEWGDWLVRSPYINILTITGVALLMVSTIPTLSFKRFRLPSGYRHAIPLIFGVGLLIALLKTAPWPMLTAIGFCYLASIPLTLLLSRNSDTAAGRRPI